MDTLEPVIVDEQRIVAWCSDYIAKTLGFPVSQIQPSDALDAFGLDSAITTALALDLENWLGVEVPLAILFEQRTLADIGAAVAKLLR